MSIRKILITTTILGIATACQQESQEIETKKNELYALREQQKTTDKRIIELETEIRAVDPSFEVQFDHATLVSTIIVSKQEFKHKIEVRGRIASRQNIMVSAEIPARVKSVNVREGQIVRKGEVLMVLDAESIQRNVDEIKIQLDLAIILFERQARLWEKKVGSEVQYLEAENRKESLERRLASAYTQLDKTKVRAPFSGSIDNVAVKQGEFVMTGMPIVRVVNLDDLYIKADVSERYVGKFKKGDLTEVYLPSYEVRLQSEVEAVGDVIILDNRTFTVEVSLKGIKNELKPNMVVVLSLVDYLNKDAVVVPTNLIQNDDIGAYVYSINEVDNKQVANKVHIQTGKSYKNMTEVNEGLKVGSMIVENGFRDLSEGTIVKIVEDESLSLNN